VFAVLAALVAGCLSAVPSVVRFSIRDDASRVKAFSFQPCDPTNKGTFDVTSLTLGPDPLVFPGPLNIGFSVNVVSAVDAPLNTVVTLKKRVGSVWIKIPCIGNIGSCTYGDLCENLSTISECPGPFVDNGVPCKCPFKKGTYKLPSTSFDVDSALFPSGDYFGQANMTINGGFVGCYNLTATFG